MAEQSRGQQRAADAVAAEMAERGWNNADLVAFVRSQLGSSLDPGTVGDFLNYTRWPKLGTQGKIEAALGWEPGTIRSIASGAEGPTYVTSGDGRRDNSAAVRRYNWSAAGLDHRANPSHAHAIAALVYEGNQALESGTSDQVTRAYEALRDGAPLDAEAVQVLADLVIRETREKIAMTLPLVDFDTLQKMLRLSEASIETRWWEVSGEQGSDA